MPLGGGWGLCMNRIKTLRQARGYTLDELVAHMGGVVTKQALSKYETGKARPMPSVAVALARALGVKTAALFSEPSYDVQFLAYRKHASMGVRQQEELQSRLAFQLEQRLTVQHRLGLTCELGFERRAVQDQAGVEVAAQELRDVWRLGAQPIRNLTELLERKGVHLLDVTEAGDGFHGLSAQATVAGGSEVCGAMIAYSAEVSGERQRSTLGHELGHLLLDVPEGKSGENLVQSFAGAFLMPAELMFETVGRKRTSVTLLELATWKQAMGVSMQNLIYRCKTLGIMTDSLYTVCFKEFSKRGWRKAEPEPLPAEEPVYWSQLLRRAHSEGILSAAEVNAFIPGLVEAVKPVGIDRQAFLRLPPDQRNRILAEQASAAQADYEPGGSMAEWIDEFVDEDVMDDL